MFGKESSSRQTPRHPCTAPERAYRSILAQDPQPACVCSCLPLFSRECPHRGSERDVCLTLWQTAGRCADQNQLLRLALLDATDGRRAALSSRPAGGRRFGHQEVPRQRPAAVSARRFARRSRLCALAFLCSGRDSGRAGGRQPPTTHAFHRPQTGQADSKPDRRYSPAKGVLGPSSCPFQSVLVAWTAIGFGSAARNAICGERALPGWCTV